MSTDEELQRMLSEPIVVTEPVRIVSSPDPEITAEWLVGCRGKVNSWGQYAWDLVPVGGVGELVFDLEEMLVKIIDWDGDPVVNCVTLMRCSRQSQFLNLLYALGIPQTWKD